jgi:hypothetical protein
MDDRQLSFDFSEFAEAANKKAVHTGRRPPDLPFEMAYNEPPGNAFLTVLNKRIELNKKHCPTKRGWKSLYQYVSAYRSKRYELFRYLLIDTNGTIVDHVALTNYLPNRVKVHPDDKPGEQYFKELAEYAVQNDYKIIMVHNHPSGNVEPSDEDKAVTKYCQKRFTRHFAGHLILDHGSFGLYIPGKEWETIYRKTAADDPLVKQNREAIFNYELNGRLSAEQIHIMRCALKIDDGGQWNSRDWVAVAFTSGWGYINALHYYHTSEFHARKAADFLLKKTADIARRSGAVWAFAVTDNDAMLEPLKKITKKTGIFRDFYANGIIGSDLGIGGSVKQYFASPAEIISTIPFENGRRQTQKTAPVTAAASAGYLREEEKNMHNDSGEKELSREKHRAVVEFLARCGNMDDISRFYAFYNGITGLREFQFLAGYVPRQEEADWPRYREAVNDRYNEELRRYYERFPDPLPDPFSPPVPLKEGGRVSYTPADFLETADTVSSAGEYRELYAGGPPFAGGTVKAVSPRKIALFYEEASLPLILSDNAPENWAKLYKTANDNGIAVNNTIPSPGDVERMGTGIIRAAREQWENARSEQWQREEFRRTCARDWRTPGSAMPFQDFYEHPYTAGTPVPAFLLPDENGGKLYTGFSFKAAADDGRSLTLAGKSPEGKEETVTVSAPFYKTMIDNAEARMKKPETTPEVLRAYESMIAKDAGETRPNSAANFWHNYKILCRRQASNPQEAMEVAKAVVGQMPLREQEKFRRNIKAYERATRNLVTNPLLRPFVKPQETYNQRILNYYEENVKDLPIKDTSVHGQDALTVIRHGVTSSDVPGQAIDPALRLKIGDTVKLSLDCKTLFGENRKRLPVTEFTVVSASDDLNKIVLVDKKGNSKYTLAKDAFTGKMRKLERKQEKRRHKQEDFEFIRY